MFRIRLDGDTARAGAYVGFAKKKLTQLYQRIKMYPGHAPNQHVISDDGTRIHLQAGAIGRITIQSPLVVGTTLASVGWFAANYKHPTTYLGLSEEPNIDPYSPIYLGSESTLIVRSIMGKPYPITNCIATNEIAVLVDPEWFTKGRQPAEKDEITSVFHTIYGPSVSSETCAAATIDGPDGGGGLLTRFYSDFPDIEWTGTRCLITRGLPTKSFMVWKGNLYLLDDADIAANYSPADFTNFTADVIDGDGNYIGHNPLILFIAATAGISGAEAASAINALQGMQKSHSTTNVPLSLNFLTNLNPDDV